MKHKPWMETLAEAVLHLLVGLFVGFLAGMSILFSVGFQILLWAALIYGVLFVLHAAGVSINGLGFN